MRYKSVITTVAGVLLAVSCMSVDSKKKSREKYIKETKRLQLKHAEIALDKDQPRRAIRFLKPVLDDPVYSRQAMILMKEAEHSIKLQEALAKKNAMIKQEYLYTQEEFLIPENYRKVRYRTGETGPFEEALGEAEKLLTMKVDINLMNATVQDILDFLTEQDGLNVIADEGISTTDTITVRLKQVELRKVLDFIQSNMSLEFHIDDNVLWVTQSDEEEVLGPGLETRVIKLRKGYIVSDAGGSAGGGDIDDAGGFSSGGGESSQAEGGESQNHGSDELYDILNLFFGEEASQEQPEGAFFKLYRNRNTLVIHNTKRNIRKAMELINAFDVDPLQVNIETKIISMTMQDLFSLGTEIQRLQNDRNDNPQFSGSTAFGFLNNPTSTFSFGGVIDDLQYEFLFSAVQELDSAQELSQPSMTVVNNHTAKLQRGQVLTYFDEFDTENSGGENPVQTIVPSGEAQELELGLNYNVRPSVGNDQETITMAVNLSFRTFLGFDTYGGTAPDDDDDTDPEPIDDNDNPNGLLEGEGSVVQVPRYDENAISTIANVLSGQTIVLGGQYDSSIQEVESKVPFLGDLPIIGFLFKKVERIDEPKHLLIFIKATIVDPDGKFVFPDMEE